MRNRTYEVYLYEDIPKDFTEHGITLIDFEQLPEITRSINSTYSFYGVYKLNGQFREEIKRDRYVKAIWEDGSWQFFKIFSVRKNLSNVSFTAQHIGFEAKRNFIPSSFTANGNGSQIMSNLASNLAFKQPFVYKSDITTKHQFTAKEVNPIDAMIGQNNGNQNLAGVISGELDMDNYNLTMKQRIGTDSGFRIDFGINLESIEEFSDDSSVINSLYLVGGEPEGKQYDSDQPPITYKYLEVSGVNDQNKRIGRRENSECKTTGELIKWGKSLFDKERIHEPKVTHSVNMISLENTTEYSAIYNQVSRLHFGDTAQVRLKEIDIEIEERLFEGVFYPTLFKWKSVVLGNDLKKYSNNIQTQLVEAKKELVKTSEKISKNLIQASQMITGNSGGHVIQVPKNEPSDIGIMDTDDITTAKHVLRMNKSGIGFSKNGWNGDFLTAWTIDGIFNADFIRSGILEGIMFRTSFEKSFTGIEIEKGRINFIGWDGKTKIGRITPVSSKDAEGISIILEKGNFFMLTDGDGAKVLEIPYNSKRDAELLNTFGTMTHDGDLHVKGDLYIERGKLFIDGQEIKPGGNGSGGGGGGGVPPELTTDQEKNAWAIWQFFKEKGWSVESIAGMLGNMQSESGIMPDIDEISGGGGYGLVQWTPKSKLVDWCNDRGLDYRTLDAQCQRIQWEMENNVQWFPNYERPDLANISFKEFTKLKDVKLAADYFIAFYEHPKDVNQPIRGTQAQYWYDKLKDLKPPTAGWLSPVRANYVVTQEWDEPDYNSGGAAGTHGGIDLASVPAGSTPDIYAANSGTIMTVGSNPTLEGNYIMIDHGNSYYTYYGHLSSINVKQGDKVTNATVIGVMGTTGASTGVHLHFEVRRGDSTATSRINPRDVITF
ncbi:phage tail tip lysozyme [Enterococcus wangshanyuanii]|uniref:Phage minor structural protein n=1 Tax=Enterococcus wangshanyuanii TaxID=2005703 RepID=A0ABQ1NT41_9ENTE|nr:phage tail tip lysozyme [Enterococcus wangshanyuanii]GGC84235.1 phage minor structural protein [Enterococcus wangshanyuanii]